MHDGDGLARAPQHEAARVKGKERCCVPERATGKRGDDDEGAATRCVRAEEVDEGGVLEALERAEDAHLVRGERERWRRGACSALRSCMQARRDVVCERVRVEPVGGDGEAEGAAGEVGGGGPRREDLDRDGRPRRARDPCTHLPEEASPEDAPALVERLPGHVREERPGRALGDRRADAACALGVEAVARAQAADQRPHRPRVRNKERGEQHGQHGGVPEGEREEAREGCGEGR